jgi:DNA processing protein
VGTGSMSQTDGWRACGQCLRRSAVVARLAPWIAGLLDRPRPRLHGLLGLEESALLAAVAGDRAGQIASEFERFDAEAVRERLACARVDGICRHSPDYPSPLLELHDPPAVLFALGRLEAMKRMHEEPAVAIVGTRNPSPYGTEVAYSLGRGLGAAGVPVVSGLALGIDATAHRGCLDGRGFPVAVLAGGPDVVYPRRHRRLHERVRETGVVVSEFPPGTEPYRWSFPARNRIMAGLTRMTVVVEAAEPSGSLITTDFARDLGRSVAAVPGRVTSRFARGTNGLLKDGAVPITGTEDVLDELFGAGVRRSPTEAVERVEPADRVLARVLVAAEGLGSVTAIAEATRLSTGETRAAIARLEADGYLVRRSLEGWERGLGAPILPDP